MKKIKPILLILISFKLAANNNVISCKATGEIYVNGYHLIYLANYNLANGKGTISVSGKAFKDNNYIGILGRQISFDYTKNDNYYLLKTTEATPQVENQISESDTSLLMPKFFYEKDSTQRMIITKIGNGYQINFNSYPTAYCSNN